VGAYLVTAFAVSLITLLALTAMTTISSFTRERKGATAELHGIAERVAGWSDLTPTVDSFLDQLISKPELTSFDPAACQSAFEGLKGLLDAQLHVLRSDGSEVCRLADRDGRGGPLTETSWVSTVMQGKETYVGAPMIDPYAHTPAALVAKPVRDGDGQPIGVLAAVMYTGATPLEEGEHFPKADRVFVLDSTRTLVLGTTTNARRFLGTSVHGRPALHGNFVWVEVKTPNQGWYVQAAVPTDVALAPARAELKRTAAVGLASILVVLLLGALLHRRLARPIRRLGRALERSRAGDEAARAPVEGPVEVAHAAQVFNDLIGERQAREAELAWQAYHDVLTALPNRAALAELLGDVLMTSADDVAVLFLDLDRFKLINDSHGHAVGDRVLIALGQRLQVALDRAGVVGRFGGDEFVAVCPGVGGEPGARAMAGRIAEALKTPLRFEAQEIWLDGSIGIALPKPGDSADDVLRNADTAMYRAKENGRGGYAVFDQQMREWAILRLDIERDLHRAVERNELVLHYQPKVALNGGAPVGAEALLRWVHPDRGMVSPADFIPVAEETGLIVPIGRWVLEQAAAQASAWRRTTGRPVPVAVNLSAHQLGDPSLPAQVADALQRAHALPTDVVIEITESAVLQDVEGATERLQTLRAMGVRVSVDDFGTGYSSLSYLQRLPIDELKIDRSFVQRLDNGATGAIVGSIVGLAHAIGLAVVAEGIETEDQLGLLRTMACDLGQGFLLARPQPSHEAELLLRRPSLAPSPVR
jgi:diguanylate cyclase (GGDEF)-like protein